jgi:hypothetical protein
MEADFSGYATKAGLKCTDGRTITPEAFKHQDGETIPLVWQHGHDDVKNVLGHAVLEARDDGMYALCYTNETDQGKSANQLVQHGDIKHLSIYANGLVEKVKTVLHGSIKELSLVLSGANPGALIDYVKVAHSDGDVETLEDEAVIYTGLELVHGDASVGKKDDKSADDVHVAADTAQEVYDAMTDEQKQVVHFMVGAALQSAADAAQSAIDKKDDKKNDTSVDDKGDLTHEKGTDDMTRNVFDTTDDGKTQTEKHVLSHDDMKGIFDNAAKIGSLKEAVEEYALAHGITNISVLFPDAQNISNTPDFNKRRTEWVANVLNGTRHSPFSRVKTIIADITMDTARALGYIKGSLKKEEWFSVSKRTTTPTTIYKKQKLDRDDILDITDFDVVTWMKGEMRLMLEEELARSILVGDGRAGGDPDKILDPLGVSSGAGIRSILNDHELYVSTLVVNIADASSSYLEVIEEIIRGRRFFKGTGTPTFYTTLPILTEMLLVKDTQNRRIYNDKQELANALMVQDIVPVEIMEDTTAYPNLLGIIVNLNDYNIGADKGGEVNLFDMFDIDYNQYKYLIETRVSGALVKIRSAQVIKTTAAANVLIKPTAPTFVQATGVVTIPTQTGTTYKNGDTLATLSAGAQTALTAGQTLNVIAVATGAFYYESNQEDQWSFTKT